MRCIALAQSWQDRGGRVVFRTWSTSPTLINRIEQAGFELDLLDSLPEISEDARITGELCAQKGCRWLVADGYHFTPAFQKQVRTYGVKLLLVDDYAHHDVYAADALLNQNVAAGRLNYNFETPVRLLLGLQYVMLRREFLVHRSYSKNISSAKRILITMGGADPGNLTAKVLGSIGMLGRNDLEVRALVGSANPNIESLRELRQTLKANIELQHDIIDIPALMSWADMAITAGGSTCYELCFFGVPMLALAIAENQRGICAGLDRAGVAINLGWHEQLGAMDISEALFKLLSNGKMLMSMSDAGRNMVDGFGAKRVVEFIGN